MPRRRRVYVFDLAAILADAPPPPKRHWLPLLLAVLTGILLALGIVFVRLMPEAIPDLKMDAALALVLLYLTVVLLFWAVAMRLRWWRQ
jgi:hypothetical protein